MIFKEGCHEKHEANCDLPPRFDELEIEEVQVPDLEQCAVVGGTEELLCHEECPHFATRIEDNPFPRKRVRCIYPRESS